MVERRPWVARRHITTLETTEVSENTGDENREVLIALGRFPPSCVGCYVVHGQADSIQTKAKSKLEQSHDERVFPPGKSGSSSGCRSQLFDACIQRTPLPKEG